MTFEREMLPDRPDTREEFLRTFWVAKAAHAPLVFTRGLMAVQLSLRSRAAGWHLHHRQRDAKRADGFDAP
jgi:hypothetical protein